MMYYYVFIWSVCYNTVKLQTCTSRDTNDDKNTLLPQTIERKLWRYVTFLFHSLVLNNILIAFDIYHYKIFCFKGKNNNNNMLALCYFSPLLLKYFYE